MNLDDATFETQYLNPFYDKAIDKLRSIDSNDLAMIQPPLQSKTYQISVNRDQVVYAPHFYPNLRDYLVGRYITTEYVVLEHAAVNLFIKNNLSFTRSWYADDDGAVRLAGRLLRLGSRSRSKWARGAVALVHHRHFHRRREILTIEAD